MRERAGRSGHTNAHPCSRICRPCASGLHSWRSPPLSFQPAQPPGCRQTRSKLAGTVNRPGLFSPPTDLRCPIRPEPAARPPISGVAASPEAGPAWSNFRLARTTRSRGSGHCQTGDTRTAAPRTAKRRSTRLNPTTLSRAERYRPWPSAPEFRQRMPRTAAPRSRRGCPTSGPGSSSDCSR